MALPQKFEVVQIDDDEDKLLSRRHIKAALAMYGSRAKDPQESCRMCREGKGRFDPGNSTTNRG